MNLQEHITRERISLRELKTSVIDQIERGFKKEIDRLDDLELRLEKEKLTGGEVTFKVGDPESVKDPQIDAAVVDAGDVMPSLNGGKAK
jgi:hypothetical protein